MFVVMGVCFVLAYLVSLSALSAQVILALDDPPQRAKAAVWAVLTCMWFACGMLWVLFA